MNAAVLPLPSLWPGDLFDPLVRSFALLARAVPAAHDEAISKDFAALLDELFARGSRHAEEMRRNSDSVVAHVRQSIRVDMLDDVEAVATTLEVNADRLLALEFRRLPAERATQLRELASKWVAAAAYARDSVAAARAELDEAAASDPVLASLINAPDDDEVGSPSDVGPDPMVSTDALRRELGL